MKFTVSSSSLLKQVNILSGAIQANPDLPVLEDFLFVANKNELTITATNLETTMISRVAINSEEDGSVAIPARILLDTLKALPDQPITLIVEKDTNHIEITSSYGKYKLTGDSADEFPELPKLDIRQEIEVDAAVISKALNNTLFATSNDDLRAAMTGVYVVIDYNKITFVATDAHKLVKYTSSGIETEATGSFIVPKKSMNLLKNALIADEKVKLSYNKTNAFFNFGSSELVCRLIDAKYPDYNMVIPVDNPNYMIVNRTDFQQSLRRIAIYANKSTNQVGLNINDGSLTISAQDLDFSNEATEQLACHYEGEPINIGFNARFLAEMVSAIDGEEIKLEMSTPSRAGIVLPTEQENNEDLLMLIMPVMVNS